MRSCFVYPNVRIEKIQFVLNFYYSLTKCKRKHDTLVLGRRKITILSGFYPAIFFIPEDNT